MQRLLLLCTLALAACGNTDEAPGPTDNQLDGPPVVVASCYPVQFLVERLAGDAARLRCDLEPGEDPRNWMPADEEVLAYQSADLILLQGAGLESWVDKVSLPPSRTVDLSSGYGDQLIEVQTFTHSHGDGSEHSHGGLDPHTWLDPRLLAQQAEATHAALIELLPDEGETLAANLRTLLGDLAAFEDLDGALPPLAEGVTVYAQSPSYAYLARRLGWEIQALYLDPAHGLNDHDMDHLRADVTQEGTRFLLWESEPVAGTIEKLETELGLTSLVVPTGLELAPDQRDAGLDLLDILHTQRDLLSAIAP